MLSRSETLNDSLPARGRETTVRFSKKKTLLFSLTIFIIFLFIVEGVLRFLGLPATLRQDPGLMYAVDNAIGFEHAPEWKGYHAGAMLHINSFGFRGKEFSTVKPPGVTRILGLGDSYTLGMAVGDEDTYLAQLEEMLNRDPGGRFETINSGHQNMNTRHELEYLKERNLMGLDPDIVILGFTMHNDAQHREERYGKRLRRALKKSGPLMQFRSSSGFKRVSESFRIVGIIGTGIDWLYEGTVTDLSFKIILSNYEEGSKTWETCRESLLGIYQVCRERNVPLIVAIFPIFTKKASESLDKYPEEAKSIHEKLRSVFTGKTGVTVVDLFDDLAATGLTTRQLKVPIDGHPNRFWHEVVAKRLHLTINTLGPGRP